MVEKYFGHKVFVLLHEHARGGGIYKGKGILLKTKFIMIVYLVAGEQLILNRKRMHTWEIKKILKENCQKTKNRKRFVAKKQKSKTLV